MYWLGAQCPPFCLVSGDNPRRSSYHVDDFRPHIRSPNEYEREPNNNTWRGRERGRASQRQCSSGRRPRSPRHGQVLHGLTAPPRGEPVAQREGASTRACQPSPSTEHPAMPLRIGSTTWPHYSPCYFVHAQCAGACAHAWAHTPQQVHRAQADLIAPQTHGPGLALAHSQLTWAPLHALREEPDCTASCHPLPGHYQTITRLSLSPESPESP